MGPQGKGQLKSDAPPTCSWLSGLEDANADDDSDDDDGDDAAA